MQNEPPDSLRAAAGKPPSEGRLGPLRSLIRYTRGLIVDQHLRRVTMFYTIIAAMLMPFVGELFLDSWLRQNVWRMLIYYLVCGWLTIVSALLAIYDILMLRLQHRLIRRHLRSDLLGDEGKDEES